MNKEQYFKKIADKERRAEQYRKFKEGLKNAATHAKEVMQKGYQKASEMKGRYETHKKEARLERREYLKERTTSLKAETKYLKAAKAHRDMYTKVYDKSPSMFGDFSGGSSRNEVLPVVNKPRKSKSNSLFEGL